MLYVWTVWRDLGTPRDSVVFGPSSTKEMIVIVILLRGFSHQSLDPKVTSKFEHYTQLVRDFISSFFYFHTIFTYRILFYFLHNIIDSFHNPWHACERCFPDFWKRLPTFFQINHSWFLDLHSKLLTFL